jgi:hypothetical protein
MLKAVKQLVHRMTNHLQLISGYLELEDYIKAMGKTRETIKEMHAVATSLNGLGRRGDDRAKGRGGRGSAWLQSCEPRRCERGHRE